MIAESAASYTLSPDATSALVSRGNELAVVSTDPSSRLARVLDLSALHTTVVPPAERREVFEQA